MTYDERMTNLREEARLSQRLIQAASPSGAESPATTLLLDTFNELGYDEAYLDDAGNAIGVFKRGDGPNVMMNGHVDTVPLGDETLWEQAPLSGAVVNDMLWGRGSVDMKSAVACMTYAAKDAIEKGFTGTLMVSGVVQEEVGGLGARYLGKHTNPDVIILGEPSSLRLMLGHRGRAEFHVTLNGKIAHAAKAELGDNALYHAAPLLDKLKNLTLPSGGPLGKSTLTPTRLISFPQDGANVVPGRAELTIDYRNIPGDEPQSILALLESLTEHGTVRMPEEHAVSENGKVVYDFPRYVAPYLAPGESTFVTTARQVIRSSLSHFDAPYAEDVWWFATDAPWLSVNGAPVIGFGPGDETLAHTTRECVPLRHLEIARSVYTALALAYSGA